jgi:hypothetical protein
MHSSWSGSAILAALVLVCAKTALFTHYGLFSLAPAPRRWSWRAWLRGWGTEREDRVVEEVQAPRASWS